MDTIEFNKLDVLKQIEYINSKLALNLTLREVIERDLKLTRSTIRSRFKKYGYTYNKKENQYIYTNNNKNITKSNITNKEICKEDTKVSNKNLTRRNITKVTDSNKNSINYTNITSSNIDNKPTITEDTNASTKSNIDTAYVKNSNTYSIDSNITDSNITKDITFTKEEIIALKKLVAKNKNHQKVIDPNFTGDVTVKYVKIYNTVLKDYNNFLEKHTELKHQDVISLAIKEFLDKYK
ncbi:hypothetical protein [Clostridium botulinum]|uniref:hypothetical protein n=1 Tax=Clostridium botulinum TaxID=1491 RepID=UPI003DA694CF